MDEEAAASAAPAPANEYHTYPERMDFSDALRYVKGGFRIARAGWNGKGMYLFLVSGSTFQVSADRPMGKACPELVGQSVDYHAHIDMKTAQGYVVPWLCSQADMLADDWSVVPNP